METSWKNRLQEYCQKKRLRLPNYRIVQESSASNCKGFQVEVEVNGQCYVSDENCSSKKGAEQSAAQKACADLLEKSQDLGSAEQHGANSPVHSNDSSQHMPAEYADVEEYIVNMINGDGGRIRRVQPLDKRGLYRLEITGGYRYCDNIKRHHKKNQIILLVDPINKYYYQKCYDPACKGFQSAQQKIFLKSNDDTPHEPNSSDKELPYEYIPFRQNTNSSETHTDQTKSS